MTYQGVVQNGAVVLHGDSSLPDGTLVAVVPLLPTQQTDTDSCDTRTVWQKLVELGRWAETQPTDLPTDLATDLAANHDHYLHGLPKRQ